MLEIEQGPLPKASRCAEALINIALYRDSAHDPATGVPTDGLSATLTQSSYFLFAVIWKLAQSAWSSRLRSVENGDALVGAQLFLVRFLSAEIV